MGFSSAETFDFFVPRFFLVDLASACMCVYDIDREFKLFVDGGNRIYVGQGELGQNEDYNDGQRQGYHFESQVRRCMECRESTSIRAQIDAGGD